MSDDKSRCPICGEPIEDARDATRSLWKPGLAIHVWCIPKDTRAFE